MPTPVEPHVQPQFATEIAWETGDEPILNPVCNRLKTLGGESGGKIIEINKYEHGGAGEVASHHKWRVRGRQEKIRVELAFLFGCAEIAHWSERQKPLPGLANLAVVLNPQVEKLLQVDQCYRFVSPACGPPAPPLL